LQALSASCLVRSGRGNGKVLFNQFWLKSAG
jgi:hypothetical protein